MFTGTNLLVILGFGLVSLFCWLIFRKLNTLHKEVKHLREELKKQNTLAVLTPAITSSTYNQEVLLPDENLLLQSSPNKPAPNKKKPLIPQQDWEKFIGENLINKIGIAILVLGIGFFVRFAIEQNWINEVGRVMVGTISGALLLGIAHRLRNGFPAFSSVLIGGGLAVLYFTIALAFHQYQLLSQTVAFLCMVAITGLSVFLALLYNRKVLAILALLGGFAAPFMTSAGGNNYLVLFTYVLILNVGMLVLAYFKRWSTIILIAYIATVALFTGWLFSGLHATKNPPYLGSWIFAVLFYLIFLLMDIIYNLGKARKYTRLEIGVLLSNTSFFYIAGIYLLGNINGGVYQGIYTGVLAIFNAGVCWYLYSQTRTDKQVTFLFGGAAIGFLYMAILLELLFQLKASVISFEGKVLITATYHYLFICLLLFYFTRYATLAPQVKRALLIGGAAIISYVALALYLLPDIRNNYVLSQNTSAGPFLLHYAALVLIVIILYLGNQLLIQYHQTNTKLSAYRVWFTCIVIVFLLSSELDNLAVLSFFSKGSSIAKILSQNHRIGFALLWGISSFGFMLVGMKKKDKSLRIISLTLFFITLLKLFLFDIRAISAGGRITAFILLGILLLVVSFLYQKLKVLILEEDRSQEPA